MNIKSIIDNIKYSIASENDGRIVLTESSSLLDLLNENEASQKEFKPHFDWRDFKGHAFPITRYLLRLIQLVVDVIIWLGYEALRLLRLPIVGKKRDKDLSASPRVNFVVFVSIVVFYIMMIITILIFFIKSVLLFTPDGGINSQGAIVIPQDCGQEHYIYLFNSATCWANTGIKVLEGDEIELSASGSFFGKIAQMDSCANNNSKPQYPRTIISYYKKSYADENEEDTITQPIRQLLMYNTGETRFGSLLMLIKEDDENFLYDSKDDDGGRFIQIDFKGESEPPHISVKKSGVIYFAVNDIYLSDRVLQTIKKDPDLQRYLSVDSICYADGNNRHQVRTSSLPDSLFAKIDRFMWFEDNVGEILLNITVARDILPASSFEQASLAKAYRWIEKKYVSKSSHFFTYFLLGIMLWLVFDRLIGILLRKHTGCKATSPSKTSPNDQAE